MGRRAIPPAEPTLVDAAPPRRWSVSMQPRPGTERTLLFLAWFAQLAILLVVASRHELWRDEADVWLFLRDGSAGELWSHLKHRADPGLWHVVLAPFVRAGLPVAAMTYLNVAIVSAGVAIFLRWAPLPLVVKLLLPFGVLPLHEYGVVARSYGLSFTLLMAICALLASRRSRPIATGALLALFANTNVHSLILGAGLGLFWLIDAVRRRESSGAARPGRVALGMAIALGGAALSIALLLPPADAQNFTPTWDVSKVFWNALKDAFAPPVPWRFGAVLGGVCLLAVLLLATTQWELVALAGVSVGLLSVLFLLIYPPFLRHAGFYLLTAIAVLWLERRSGTRPSRWRPVVAFAFGISLLLGAVEGIRRGVLDYREPFTSAPEAAAFLDTLDISPDAVAVFPAAHCESILLYSSSLASFWYPGHGARGSYMPWNRTFVQGMLIDVHEALRRARRVYPEPHPLVFVTMRKLERPGDAGLALRFETSQPPKRFKRDEHFYIYASPNVGYR